MATVFVFVCVLKLKYVRDELIRLGGHHHQTHTLTQHVHVLYILKYMRAIQTFT